MCGDLSGECWYLLSNMELSTHCTIDCNMLTLLILYYVLMCVCVYSVYYIVDTHKEYCVFNSFVM